MAALSQRRVCVCVPDGDASNMQSLGGNYNNEQTVYLSCLVSSKRAATLQKRKQRIRVRTPVALQLAELSGASRANC